MISQLTGNIVNTFENYITVDVHDVGYAVYTTDQWKSKHTPGTKTTLVIYTHVKEDTLELYGFETNQEKKLFVLLLSVSGIGPRTALTIMNMGVQHIEHAISDADVTFFTSIPRIGKKNAQKIIIELKNKIGGLGELDLSSDSFTLHQDIIEALTSMGFAKIDIQRLLNTHYQKEKSLEENMKIILKQLSKA